MTSGPLSFSRYSGACPHRPFDRNACYAFRKYRAQKELRRRSPAASSVPLGQSAWAAVWEPRPGKADCEWEKREMNRVLFAASAAALVASAASADVVFCLTDFRIEGNDLAQFAGEGQLDGVLTGATIDIVMSAWTNYTYADDLCIYLDSGPTFNPGGALQIGGFKDYNADERVELPTQARRGLRTLTFAVPVDVGTKDLRLWIGNSFGGSTTTGTWNGTITLHGLSGIPAPGAVALLGLAGLVAQRRRRG